MRNRIARLHSPLPLRPLLAAASLLLAACVSQPVATPPLASLAQDREEPALALIEHALSEHFARDGVALDPPTTCVELSPDALTAAQEQALIARFPRLAPRDRCETENPPPSDEFTGERAVLVRVHAFRCSDPAHCTARVTRPGSPVMRYVIEFTNNSWRFAGDPQILAE